MFTRETNHSLLTGMRHCKVDSSTRNFLTTPSFETPRKIRHKGIGKGGAKRTRKQTKDIPQGISASAIRKLARRGGVKRMSKMVYSEVRNALKDFLHKVLKDTVLYTESAQKSTVTAMDVAMALKKQGKRIYGFD